MVDSELLAVAHSGGEQAFTRLLAPLVEPGYRLACAMLHDSHAAEDVVQEASLTAWRKLDRVRDPGRLRPWFLGIVANECRNARRLRWVANVRMGLPARLSVVSPEEGIVRRADLRRALSRLGHRDRLAVVLYFYLDLPLVEVAQVLGVKTGAARARLYRSIHRLRPDVAAPEELP